MMNKDMEQGCWSAFRKGVRKELVAIQHLLVVIATLLFVLLLLTG